MSGSVWAENSLEVVNLASEPDFHLGLAWVRPSLAEVLCLEQRIRLQPRVMQVLVALARSDGAVVSRDELVARCWGGAAVGEDALNRCVQRLRRLSAELPDAFSIETVPRVGYRLERVGPTEASSPPTLTSPSPKKGPIARKPPLAELWRQHAGAQAWRRAAIAAGAVILAGAAAFLFLPKNTGDLLGGREKRLIAVAPLQVRDADGPARVVELGLSSELARAIVGNPARFSVEELSSPAVSAGHAQLILSGNADSSGPDLHAQVQLRDPASNQILWSRDFAGSASQPDLLREQIAVRIGAVLNCALSARHRGSRPVGDEAVRLYLAACDHISDYDLGPALDLLRQVVVLAPNFARAWADLATTEALAADDLSVAQRASAFARAASDAKRALALDPKTGLAYYALAQTMPGIQDWRRRVDLIGKGLAVEPDSSELNNDMGDELLRVGRNAEGLVYLRRSMEFDTLNPAKTISLIHALIHTGHMDEAEDLISRARRAWPREPDLWVLQFKLEAREGDPLKAEALLDDPDRLGARDPAEVAFWRALLRARRTGASADMDAAVRAVQSSPYLAVRNEPLIRAYELAQLGKHDLAYNAVLPTVATLTDDQDDGLLFRDSLQGFRADPRFRTLAERIGLLSVWRSTGRWPDFCAVARPPYACAR